MAVVQVSVRWREREGRKQLIIELVITHRLVADLRPYLFIYNIIRMHEDERNTCCTAKYFCLKQETFN